MGTWSPSGLPLLPCPVRLSSHAHLLVSYCPVLQLLLEELSLQLLPLGLCQGVFNFLRLAWLLLVSCLTEAGPWVPSKGLGAGGPGLLLDTDLVGSHSLCVPWSVPVAPPSNPALSSLGLGWSLPCSSRWALTFVDVKDAM